MRRHEESMAKVACILQIESRELSSSGYKKIRKTYSKTSSIVTKIDYKVMGSIPLQSGSL